MVPSPFLPGKIMEEQTLGYYAVLGRGERYGTLKLGIWYLRHVRPSQIAAEGGDHVNVHIKHSHVPSIPYMPIPACACVGSAVLCVFTRGISFLPHARF